ncbi:hypothetical protein Hamer_G003459 [Homarus americanus]|uniref:Uncharacterized protein n=1 Tax=Homarus americanus TaxID=6706 RepID=A0A8J5MTZ0_HOMAM|nr:hypothetical protein Hamer_G003459 [Homarus americanus]
MKRFNKTRQTAAPVECQEQQPRAEDQGVKTAGPEKVTPIESKRTRHRAEDEDAVKIIFDERRNRIIETHHIAAQVERQEARQQAEDEAIKNVFNLCMKRFNKTRQTAAPVECQGQQPRAEDQGVKTAGPEKVTPIESKRTRHRAEDEDAVKIIFDERRNRLIETHHIAAQVERQEARQQAEDEAIKNVFNLCMKRFNKTRQTAAPVECQGQQPRAEDQGVKTAGPEKVTPIESKRTRHRAEDEDAVKIIFDERRNRLIETHHIAAQVERQEARQQAEDEAIKNVFNLCMKRFNKTRQTAAPSSMESTRSKTEVWLIGQHITEITGAQLPSRGDVLRLFFHGHNEHKKTVNDSASEVAASVISFWNKARIPTITEKSIGRKVVDLFLMWKGLKKNCTRTTDTQRKKEETFCDELEDLFDVAHPKAMQLLTIKEDRAFLAAQREKGRRGVMAGVDKKIACSIKRREESKSKQSLQQNQASSALEYDELGSSSETESQSSSSSSTSSLAISPVVSSSNRKRATLKVITPELSSTLDRTGISHRSALRICHLFHIFPLSPMSHVSPAPVSPEAGPTPHLCCLVPINLCYLMSG